MDPSFGLILVGALVAVAAAGYAAANRKTRPWSPRRISYEVEGLCSWGACPFQTYLVGPKHEKYCDWDGLRPCADCGLDRAAVEANAKVRKDHKEYTGRDLFCLRRDPNGNCVSSLCENGKHAPAVDIDLPVEWRPGALGGRLVFRKPVRPKEYWRLLDFMEQLSLTRPGAAEEWKRRLDQGELGEGYRSQAMVSDPAFELTVPAKVVPSSTPGHFHLYLETELEWGDYDNLLWYMREAGFVERGYYEMSLRRKMTMLRKPGVKKPPPIAGSKEQRRDEYTFLEWPAGPTKGTWRPP